MRRTAFCRGAWLGALFLSGCGYNTLEAQDEQVKSAWSEIISQDQRRNELIDNLVNTVKGYAAGEQKVLLGVAEARARVDAIRATPELIGNPAALARFQAEQAALTGSVAKVIAVAEHYPQLTSDQNFRDLQAELEGTENRIAVARNRYIQAVQAYNSTIRSFPDNLTAMMFGYKPKAILSAENEAEIAKTPASDLGPPPPVTAPPATAPSPGPPDAAAPPDAAGAPPDAAADSPSATDTPH